MRYHYIITIQFTIHGQPCPTWQSGIFAPFPGETRAEIFNKILASAVTAGANALRERLPGTDPADPIVMFFTLEPDEALIP